MEQRVHVLGIPVDTRARADVLARCAEALAGDRLAHVITANPEIVLWASEHPADGDILRRAAFVVPDGIGLALMVRCVSATRVPRIRGVELLIDLCRVAQGEGKSVCLVGGARGVAGAAAAILREHVPGLSVAAHNGTVRAAEEPEAFWTALGTVRPALLAVAYGAPTQERWIATHAERLEGYGVRVAIGVGGALDMLAGRLPRAPHWLRVIGSEWLWRLALEPRRLPRVLRATVRFPLSVAREKWRGTHD